MSGAGPIFGRLAEQPVHHTLAIAYTATGSARVGVAESEPVALQ